MIKNSKFLFAFLETYNRWDPSMLYHIYQKRQIPNYLCKNKETAATASILNYLCIAWVEEPIVYFDVQAEESEKFFSDFLRWVDAISNKKIF